MTRYEPCIASLTLNLFDPVTNQRTERRRCVLANLIPHFSFNSQTIFTYRMSLYVQIAAHKDSGNGGDISVYLERVHLSHQVPQ